jgi:hypothetical protein
MVGATTRVTEVGDKRLIPASVAAELHSVLDHILFALKHEGANLGVLSHALRHVPAAELDAKMRAMPNSRFVRVACYLWEHYTQARLSDPPKITGPYVDVFDPRLYFTGDEVKDARWRVRFNGVKHIDVGAGYFRRVRQARLGIVLPKIASNPHKTAVGHGAHFCVQLGSGHMAQCVRQHTKIGALVFQGKQDMVENGVKLSGD